jgi:hypothetical protein
MAIDPAAMIDKIASAQMGVPPQTPPAPAAPPKQEDVNTPLDAAVTAAAPNDENARMDEAPIAYEVDFDGEKRKLTPQQISSTFNRYSNLNHKHAQMKPVLELVEQIMEANPGSNPQQVAEYVMSLAREKQQGASTAASPPPAQPGTAAANQLAENDDPLARWERENAATLPPGYKDLMGMGESTKSEMAQIKEMLSKVLAASGGQMDAARAAHQDVRGQQVDAIKQSISNNLNRSQAKYGLPDEKAQDFMTFASERGYTMEDFIDAKLTDMVMGDYKASAESPEMDRLRQIAQRRQSFTGSLGASPSAPASAPATGADKTFQEFSNYAMAKRVG